MVLGRLRQKVNSLAPSTIGRALARAGVKADHVTAAGIAISSLAPVVAYLRALWALPLVILVSGAADVIDGAVARASGALRPFGSYLDSVSDRYDDLMYFLAVLIAGMNPYLTLVALGLSLLVSYSRAKGELLGASMEGVGLMERSERVIALVVLTSLMAAGLRLAALAVLAVIVALSAATVVIRGYQVWRSLSSRR